MSDVAPILGKLYAEGSNKTNCSGFYKAVALALKIPRPDVPADMLINEISTSKRWVKIDGPNSGLQAAKYATQGYLVVALLKAEDHVQFELNKQTKKYDIPKKYHHGHMAIVLGGETTKDGYPYVISGSTNDWGRSDGSKAIIPVWRSIDAKNVKYYRTIETFPELSNIQHDN